MCSTSRNSGAVAIIRTNEVCYFSVAYKWRQVSIVALARGVPNRLDAAGAMAMDQGASIPSSCLRLCILEASPAQFINCTVLQNIRALNMNNKYKY